MRERETVSGLGGQSHTSIALWLVGQLLPLTPPLALNTFTPQPNGCGLSGHRSLCDSCSPWISMCFSSTCKPLSLFFILPNSLCFLSLFLDGCKGTMLVLSYYLLVHMLLLPYFSHSAPASSSPHPVEGPAPSVYSDTFHTLLTELNGWITCYFSQDYSHL